MSASDLLLLSAAMEKILSRGLYEAREDKTALLEINQSCQILMRQLHKLQADPALRPEIVAQAQRIGDELQVKARLSCEWYEELGGFNSAPKAAV